jgi:bifunctional N-acetylglucosamine-1-phosphate-uridyltransferase/glucosamine-1-phosphate-acetyltransferase GlmU-like protein
VRASDEVRVVVAAGGLGTRVQHWARYLPKEFHPVGGRPGITWILEEIAGLGAAHIVIVYTPTTGRSPSGQARRSVPPARPGTGALPESRSPRVGSREARG